MDSKFLRVTLLVSLLFMFTIFFVVLYANGVGPGQKEEAVENVEETKDVIVSGQIGNDLYGWMEDENFFDKAQVQEVVEEVKKPELNAKLVAENIGFQLGKRMNFRRAVKMALASTMNAGAKGVRIEVAGRLNGAEMSRREKFIEGSVPLHTLRADIDFYCHHAPTTAGIVGVKVWIYKGEK